jgi:hypothetical protein
MLTIDSIDNHEFLYFLAIVGFAGEVPSRSKICRSHDVILGVISLTLTIAGAATDINELVIAKIIAATALLSYSRLPTFVHGIII